VVSPLENLLASSLANFSAATSWASAVSSGVVKVEPLCDQVEFVGAIGGGLSCRAGFAVVRAGHTIAGLALGLTLPRLPRGPRRLPLPFQVGAVRFRRYQASNGTGQACGGAVEALAVFHGGFVLL
jgi:hypothetical protein